MYLHWQGWHPVEPVAETCPIVAITIFTVPNLKPISGPQGALTRVAGLSGLASQGPAPWRTQLEQQGHSRGGTQLKIECRSGG